MEEKISVILVNYNGLKYNDACISSILNSTVREQIQIVVVDNASTDGSLEALQKKHAGSKQVHLIALDGNYGFSKANNEGIRWAMQQGMKYFLLLNNDTEIEADTIEQMVRYERRMQEKHGRQGIVVPKVLYADNRETIWCAGGSFTPVIKKAVQRGLNERDDGRFDQSGTCQFANGCALLLTKSIVERIGYLDDRFFLYYEDTEYSMRAGAAGVRIGYCKDAVVYHKVNGSTGGNEKPANAYYITRNWLLCNRTHMCRGREKLRFGIFVLYFACNRLAWLAIWFLGGRRCMCRAALQGIRDYRIGKWGKYDA